MVMGVSETGEAESEWTLSGRFSQVTDAKPRVAPGFTSLQAVDLGALGVYGSPLVVFDDFRVRELPFSGHPHAGFAAVTYVFPDSSGMLRSRSSTGSDLTVGAGGIVWTHAGRGIVHEEVPAQRGQELHGLQVFVNLTAQHKLSPPEILFLQGHDVPVWRNQAGDAAYVVVGALEGVVSPLTPIEPFTLLDVQLRNRIRYPLSAARNTVIYVVEGNLALPAGEHAQGIAAGQAIALSQGPGTLILEAEGPSNLLILSGMAIAEPVVEEGPFIMNSRSQIESAIARYRSGEMGGLSPA